MKEDHQLLVELLLKERDEFLEENPHLKPLQKEIDKKLEKIDAPSHKLLVINEIMLKMFTTELLPAMNTLRKIQSSLKFYENTKNVDEVLNSDNDDDDDQQAA